MATHAEFLPGNRLTLLNSGAGLLTIEATGVTANGRITSGCLGLWDECWAASRVC